jgi:uncharacterized protein (TIGR00730 family)
MSKSDPDQRQSRRKTRNPALNRAARTGMPTQDEQFYSSVPPAAPLFTHTDPWRVLRIMGEVVEGFDLLAELGPAVSIFGSARVKPEDPMYASAVELATLLGSAGFTIITGGGPGIMEAGNKGARESGAKSVGLGIELPFEQGLNAYVDIAVEFSYFFVRKTMFIKYAQAFVIFPGGFGTMDELFEALTLIQTGKIKNFPVILFGSGFWQGFLEWMGQTMLLEGKIAPADLDLLIISDSPAEVRDLIVRSAQGQPWRREQEQPARETTRRVYQNAESDQNGHDYL